MNLIWIRKDGIVEDNDIFTIPYPPPKLKHLPLMENVLLTAPIDLPKKITFNVSVEKRNVSSGLPKEKWYEFAFFLADNVVSWQGCEVGFRFPLNEDSNVFTFYVQYSYIFGSKIKDEYKYLPLDSIVEYSIEFEKVFLWLYRIKFRAYLPGSDLITHSAYAILHKKKFNIAFISHNWSKLDEQDQWMKLYNITIQE